MNSRRARTLAMKRKQIVVNGGPVFVSNIPGCKYGHNTKKLLRRHKFLQAVMQRPFPSVYQRTKNPSLVKCLLWTNFG